MVFGGERCRGAPLQGSRSEIVEGGMNQGSLSGIVEGGRTQGSRSQHPERQDHILKKKCITN